MRTTLALAALPVVALIPPASADSVQVALRGSRVERVAAGTTVLPAHQLRPGESTGAVEFAASGFAVGAADDRDLASYFARQSAGPVWEVDLGVWTDQGSGHDFFLFEVGGNDAIDVRPVFPDGSLGAKTGLSGWTGTGYHVLSGPNQGQEVFGLAFAADQLLLPDGKPLPPGISLKGLRFVSNGIDAAAFLAHRPDPSAGVDGDGSIEVHGARRVGQLVELRMQGPWLGETDLDPHPFLDHRLRVRMTHSSGTTLFVPGFFAADGAGGEWGTVWKARFRPSLAGKWVARVEFREGTDVAIDLSDPGTPGPLEGTKAVFQVEPRDPEAPGFLRWGILRHRGGHYFRFDDGPALLEVGVNSPENFLAYKGFDGVTKMPGSEGVLHTYAPHVGDWRPGDPLFASSEHGVDSRGIVGALNYLSEAGLNSIFAMPMNLGGDGQDVHPFLGPAPTDFDRTHYDTSRLAQWHQVFEHAARRGILVHLTLAETEPENEQWLDGGAFGPQRRLFLRELVARFADHPALVWDLSEETDFPVPMLRAMADWIRELDPYDHPVTFHNHFHDFSDYDQVLGEERFTTTAFQYAPDKAGTFIEKYRDLSAQSGHRWVVNAVEHSPWDEGLTDDNHDELRKRILYDGLLSGGGLQWYAGWHDLPLGGDLSLEDFRTRSAMWEDVRHATEMLRQFPFVRMEPADDLVSGEAPVHDGAECFALAGETYLVYLPDASGAAQLDLTGESGVFERRWFDPRAGVWTGAAEPVGAGGWKALGPPPHSATEDWVCLLQRPSDLNADVWSLSVSSGGTQTLTLALDPSYAGRRYRLLGSASGTTPGFPLGSVSVPLVFDRYTRFTLDAAGGPILPDAIGLVPGSGRAKLHVVLPPGGMSELVGETLHHAVVLTDHLDLVTEAVPLQLLP